MAILVTGGAGYIGSHTCVELLNAGYEVIGLDNFSNSKRSVLDRLKQITNKEINFYEGDMLDKKILEKIFSYHLSYYLNFTISVISLIVFLIINYVYKLDNYFKKIEEYSILPRNKQTVLESIRQDLEHPVFEQIKHMEEVKQIKELIQKECKCSI